MTVAIISADVVRIESSLGRALHAEPGAETVGCDRECKRLARHHIAPRSNDTRGRAQEDEWVKASPETKGE